MENIPSEGPACNQSAGLSPAMQAIHVRLVDMVRSAQETSPFEHQGQVWTQPNSQEAWCKAGGFALRTFQELIKVAPIRRLRCMIHGKITTLLRVGEPGAEHAKSVAKQMQAYYVAATKAAKLAAIERQKGKAIREAERAKSKRARSAAIKRAHLVAEEQVALAASETPKVSRDEFGMLCGLARDWPDGWQVEVFKHAIRHWPDFMDDVRLEVRLAKLFHRLRLDPFEGDALCDPTLTTARRYRGRENRLRYRRVYRRPFIPLLRAFWPVAVELFIDHRQLRLRSDHPERIWQRWSEPSQRNQVHPAESSS